MNLPVRQTRENAVIAGVCAGLARRWNIDPNLLRIGLILACLASGLGAVIYGVAVLVLPTEGGSEPPVHRYLPFTRTWPLPALIAALGVTGFLLLGLAGGWSGIGFLPVMIALGVWYFASRRRSAAPTTTADPTPFERAADAWRYRLIEHQTQSGAVPATTLATMSSQAPVLPQPTDSATELVPVRRRRSGRLWWLSFALIAVSTAAVALLQGQGVGSGALPYLAVILASLGITLLVATWRGRPRLMGFATVAVMLATLGVWAAPAGATEEFRVAEGSQRFATAGDLPAEISASVGELALDFSDLALTTDTDLNVTLGAGDVSLQLPDRVNSTITWDVGLGDVVLPDTVNHSGSSLTGSTDHVVTPGGPTLHLTVTLKVGSLEVAA